MKNDADEPKELGTYGELTAVIDLEPMEVNPPDFLLVVTPGLSSDPSWSIRIGPGGQITLPDEMTPEQAVYLTSLFSRPTVIHDEWLTPWLRETLEKWAPWELRPKHEHREAVVFPVKEASHE